MHKLAVRSAFLAATMLAGGPALAAQAASTDQDPAALAAEIREMRGRLEAMEARLQAMEGVRSASTPQPAEPVKKAEAPKPAEAPRWSGAPRFTAPGGWSFKPRGRLQFDAGWVEAPRGVTDPGLGFATELRRARLGVEGTIPGNFGYRFEIDFADNDAEITDAFLSYEPSDALEFVVGQHNNFQSLEELTSSLAISFLERTAFTDAFNFERRVGLSVRYRRSALTAQAGIFTDNIEDLAGDGGGTGRGDENESVSASLRLVYAPKLGETQLHFGGSAHHRSLGDMAASGATTRYRQRPMTHTTDTRFLATPALKVDEETHYGLEAALIGGPLHAAGEVHWLSPNLLDRAEDPTFFGGYAEIGYFLTGETRGYSADRFARTKVRRPVRGGGFGAVQLNLRYDYLDLSDAGIIGGRQRGYQASLVWIPQDYVRFLLNYGRLSYDDAAVPAAGGGRSYGIDVIGARAQVDF
jgi:phosphate-selective porin OprO/OprP